MPFGPVGFAEHDGADRLDAREHHGRRSRCTPFSPLVTSCEISAASAIGTANASSTTMTSCFGVLIGEECSSVMFAAGSSCGRGRAPGATGNYTDAAASPDGHGRGAANGYN